MVQAKICGITDPQALSAALTHGATHVGFVFFPPSPRHLDLAQARDLAARVPVGRAVRVALVVDADDDMLDGLLAEAPIDMLQLHGKETPERCAAIRARTRLPVMKAIGVAEADDLARARPYEQVCDQLLFDAKPKPGEGRGLPGGNAVAFDWTILRGARFAVPWMLAGGLTPDNVATAIRLTSAPGVDTSSGVEDAPGRKSAERIRRFLEACRGVAA